MIKSAFLFLENTNLKSLNYKSLNQNLMKRKITKIPFSLSAFCLLLFLPLFCIAQNPLPRYFEYDDAGNRTVRKVIPLNPAPPAPPEDSVASTSSATDLLQEEILESFESKKSSEYYVEKIAQVEMKIYPNPATEKITLSIFNIENLQTGTLQLYTLNGQLLQTQPIHSETTTISLAGLAKGTYILKVQINEHTEDWKIIKQ
jgi:hypothetical protein